VSEALDVPTESVTLNIELGIRRSLLSFVSLTYTASVTSGMASDVVVNKLNSAIAEGTYLELVKEKSGLPISSLKVGALADLTPVQQSTSDPNTSPSTTGNLLFFTSYMSCLSIFTCKLTIIIEYTIV
jgi:hypothetical protein